MKKRMRKRIRKNLILTGVLITMLLCSIFTVKAFANTDTSSADNFGTKQYKSIMIYCGDTVESIAEENYCFQYSSVGKMAAEIRSINNLSYDEALIPGNYLVIPYYEGADMY